MSLITLKNDTSQKPWNFRNYFRDPLIIPPKSSVSFQSAVINKGNTINTLNNNAFYSIVGVFGLNPTIQMEITQGIDDWTPQQIAVELTDEMESKQAQTAYCNFNDVALGWKAEYQIANSKMKFINVQQPLPAEASPQPFAPNTAYWTHSIVGDYLRLARTALAGIPTQVSTGCSNANLGCSIPRNGGHIIFKPEVNAGTGNFPTNLKFGIGPSSIGYSMYSYWTSPAGQANPLTPANTIWVEFYGGPAPRVRAYLNEGDMENVNAVAKGAIYQTVPANPNLTFSFEWNGAYSILIKYSTNYDPAVPANNYANAVWTTMYDMSADGGTVKSLPTFQDNLCPMIYARDVNTVVDIRATAIQNGDSCGQYDWIGEGWARSADVFDVKTDFPLGTDALAGVYPNQFLNKTIKYLVDTDDPAFDNADAQEWEEGMTTGLKSTRIGKILGFTPDVIELTPDATFQNAEVEADGILVIGNHLPQLHIQLTNFGIESKNGIVSNNVKDIAVIPLFSENNNPDSSQLYSEAQYENKINLNNLEELTVNQLDVLITTDNNLQANFLDNDTSVVIKLHKGVQEEANKT